MIVIPLYSGEGVSFSEEYVEGRVRSAYVRLVADDGMMLKNGVQTAICVDVLATEADEWTEVDYAEPPSEPTDSDKAEAYDILMGVSE
jgi:hypothetical protein